MKIICIGRNYLQHARELDQQVPEEPLFFLKPDSALLKNNRPFFIPDFSNEIHHEIEIVIRICRLGRHIAPKFAHRYYNQIGLGIDFTARDIQRKCIENGLPWEIAKGFDRSAAISSLLNIDHYDDIHKLSFALEKNNEMVQQGNTSEMIFSFDSIIAHVSKYMTLKIGDLIYTGTPPGVGAVEKNDQLTAYIENEPLLACRIK